MKQHCDRRDGLYVSPRACPGFLVVFFFFQAEDGIRDLTVTGVQTCALPIYPRRWATARSRVRGEAPNSSRPNQPSLTSHPSPHATNPEIGRASCRERV